MRIFKNIIVYFSALFTVLLTSSCDNDKFYYLPDEFKLNISQGDKITYYSKDIEVRYIVDTIISSYERENVTSFFGANWDYETGKSTLLGKATVGYINKFGASFIQPQV